MSDLAPCNLLIEACEPLLQPTGSRFEAFRLGCRAAGVREYPDKALMPGFIAADTRFATLPRPLPKWEDEISFWVSYYGEVLATLGLQASIEQLRTLNKTVMAQNRIAVDPVLPPVMQQVRRAGGRAVLVADWYASFKQTLINSGLLALFPEVFLAGQQGVYLDDQTGVIAMMRTLGLRPETTVFVGASRAAMVEIGMRCVPGEELDRALQAG
jgi:phosphoglycolate phosphatase-like HAD superfamily hydrolase